MAISRSHTWSAGEVLLASELNAEFNNIINNASDLVSPFTKAISLGGFALNFDAANTIALTAATNGISLTGGAFNTAQGADIASAATLNLDTATGNFPDVTGTTTITAVTLSQGRWRMCRFTGALTITNGASLVVEGGADFITVAGQYVYFVGYASSVVRCIPFTTPAATQTLTNKTLTSPTINTATITTPTITTPAITGGTMTQVPISQNSQSTAYTTVIGDGGKHILHPAADNNARTFTIDSNANVAYPIGTTITFVNEVNTVTISITSDTLTFSSSGGTGSRTLAASGIATALKIASTKWIISGTGLT